MADGVVHGVGAVADDDPVDPLLDLAADGLGRPDVLFGSHVLAEDAEEFLGFEVADVGQLGDRAVELARREGRDDGARPVVEPAGDRAARSQKLHPRLGRVVGKFLLGDLIVGFLAAPDLDLADALGQDSDVVARTELEHDVQGVGRLGARQDDADVFAPIGLDHDVAPDLGLEALEDLQGPALVSFIEVGVVHALTLSKRRRTSSAAVRPSSRPRQSFMTSPMT